MHEYGYERVENNHGRSRRPTLHAFGCVVDGGTKRHGGRGFDCPRCAEFEDPFSEEERLLVRIDRLSPSHAH